MFFRTTKTKGNTYLQLVEAYRNEQGKPRTRVLSNIGNISSLSEEEIDNLIRSFIRVLGQGHKFQSIFDIEVGKSFDYGDVLMVIALWESLNLSGIINRHLPEKVSIPVEKLALIMTANKWVDPRSKLGCYRWYDQSLFSQLSNFIHFPKDSREKLHMYYRSLDYLSEAKEKIERSLYNRLVGLGIDATLVLYDVTSSYFEGRQADIGSYGYSRDRRPDLPQIVIGLVMSRDGLPIAHHVFEGNTQDKGTVKEVVGDLQRRFNIKKAVFVGDRGMLSVSNIEAIRESSYEYIMGLRRHRCRIVKFCNCLAK